jgi:hypothetical protein
MSEAIDPDPGRGPTRREFAQALALLAAPVLGGSAAAQQPADPAAAPADALTELARSRYGKHLTEDDLKNVKRSIQRGQLGAELLRKVKLANGDEPAFIFTADLP